MKPEKIGDVFIFEAGESWLSKSIAFLTKSTVSHSAMLFEDGKIVEMGGSGIAVSSFEESESGDVAHLLRLKPEQAPEPLAKAARAYVESGTVYDFPDLVILGGLIIYRAIRPTPRWKKITDLILNAACYELDKLLNRILQKGKDVPAMVCSQLVYQCYEDCGKAYHIRLQQQTDKVQIQRGTVCLADLCGGTQELEYSSVTALQEPEQDIQQLAKELYEAMEEAEEIPENDLLTGDGLTDILPKVESFLDLVEKILENTNVKIPIPALFVTPADILYAENLEEYGTVRIKRV